MTVAHERARQGMASLFKKMKFAPIVSIQGPRQCGKSYLARHLITKKLKDFQYLSLDQKELRDFATDNPRSFLLGSEARHKIIDEAQKVPEIFDEMKDLVDEQRAPGQFLILGSTEFSYETRIQESLTGRISRLRLYPFNLAESKKLQLNSAKQFPFLQATPRAGRRDLLRYLDCGGLPGIFAVRSEAEQKSLWGDWIKLTVERDIHQTRRQRLSSDVALSILTAVAKLPNPTVQEIARYLNSTGQKVQKYLDVLCTLFVLFKVSPGTFSSGKALYYLTDTGLARFLGADFTKKLETWFYLELLSQLSYKDLFHQGLSFYQTSRGGRIHCVYEDEQSGNYVAVKLASSEKIDQRELLVFESLKAKLPNGSALRCIYLTGGATQIRSGNVLVSPWESII